MFIRARRAGGMSTLRTSIQWICGFRVSGVGFRVLVGRSFLRTRGRRGTPT